MPTNAAISRDVLCPFYKSGNAVAVNCEGPYNSVRLQLLMQNREDRLLHMRRYCMDQYKSCLVYQMIMKKYED